MHLTPVPWSSQASTPCVVSGFLLVRLSALAHHLEVCASVMGRMKRACHLHTILCAWDAVITCTPVTVFFPLGVRLYDARKKKKKKEGASGQSLYLIRFIDPNWDTNIFNKSPMRVTDILTPILFRFESTTGLGHTYEYSTPLYTHSSQPQAKQPMFQQKTANEIHESHHTLTLPLDSWLNLGMLTGKSDRYWKSAH